MKKQDLNYCQAKGANKVYSIANGNLFNDDGTGRMLPYYFGYRWNIGILDIIGLQFLDGICKCDVVIKMDAAQQEK